KARVERLLDDMRALGASGEIRAEILRLGLTHQLVTPYTSFLVVEDGVRIPDPGETSRVPDAPPPEVIDRNGVPKGNTAQTEGPVNPDEVIIPDSAPGRRNEVADTGEFNADPAAPADLPSSATGGTS